MIRILLAVLWTLVFVVAPAPAFAQDDDPDDPGVRPEDVHVVDPPDSPVGRELRWVLKVLNGEEVLGNLEAKFSQRFIEAYKPEQIRQTLTTLREKAFRGKRIDLVQVHEDDNEDSLSGIINGQKSNTFMSVFIALDEKTQLISGLLFDQAGYSCAAGDWNSYGGEYGRMGGSVAFAAYELVPVEADKPQGPYRLLPVYEIEEREANGVGSAFRLWPLATMAQRVADGKAAWTDTVTIKDEWKAIPGGATEQMPAGTTFTLGEIALRSAARNDSTATDHLFHTAGREAVEEYIKTTFKYQGRSFPLLSTRELLFLKLHKNKDLLTRYAENMAEVRRELLAKDGISGGTPNWDAFEDWSTPREVARVEWFASAKDQCGVLADLRRLEQLPGMEPLAAATRIDAAAGQGGIVLDASKWPDVRHVAGIEPGVISYAWLLKRADGRWYTMAMAWNDESEDIDEARFSELARAGFELLVKHGQAEKPAP
ncbi:hypothetical protein PHYC_02965 [Phycisphaerales bacterium]|nr:hypothetical protein PHYC_02965 [Phycisphaerales bacterium]